MSLLSKIFNKNKSAPLKPLETVTPSAEDLLKTDNERLVELLRDTEARLAQTRKRHEEAIDRLHVFRSDIEQTVKREIVQMGMPQL